MARDTLVRQTDDPLPRLITALLSEFRQQAADEMDSRQATLDRLDKAWRSHPSAIATANEPGKCF